MKKIFVDTNIIIDLVADRRPFSKYAIQLFGMAEEKKIRLYASSHTIATTHYLLKKYIDEKILREIIYNLVDYLHIAPVHIDIVRKSLKSKHKDFEDALQIITAYSVDKIDCIVTRNIRDFRNSELPVLTPDEVIRRI